MQYIKVEVSEGRAYTYTWDDVAEPPLEPGEAVLLPANEVRGSTFRGTVLRVVPDAGSYRGPLKAVVARAACYWCGLEDGYHDEGCSRPGPAGGECTCGADVDERCPHHGIL